MEDLGQPIFVIDDDDDVRDSLRALLKSAGFNVFVFESAQTFLNSGHLLGNGLLIIDVRMPKMDGLALQHHLIQSGIAMPIIFISAHEDERARTKAMAAGAIAFLQKPFEDHTLLNAIHRAVVNQHC